MSDEERRIEGTLFFLDDVIHELRAVSRERPTKPVMLAYISAWINTLETVKSLNE